MELLKLLNANELVAQVVSFLVLLAIMRVFLWKRFLGILDKRSSAISSEFKEIEETKNSISRIKTEYEKRLADIAIETKALIDRSTMEARQIADGIRAKAEDDGERLIEKARANLKDEVVKAKEDLKNSVVDLTIQIAEKVIQEKLSEKGDRKLVEDFINGVENK